LFVTEGGAGGLRLVVGGAAGRVCRTAARVAGGGGGVDGVGDVGHLRDSGCRAGNGLMALLRKVVLGDELRDKGWVLDVCICTSMIRGGGGTFKFGGKLLSPIVLINVMTNKQEQVQGKMSYLWKVTQIRGFWFIDILTLLSTTSRERFGMAGISGEEHGRRGVGFRHMVCLLEPQIECRTLSPTIPSVPAEGTSWEFRTSNFATYCLPVGAGQATPYCQDDDHRRTQSWGSARLIPSDLPGSRLSGK